MAKWQQLTAQGWGKRQMQSRGLSKHHSKCSDRDYVQDHSTEGVRIWASSDLPTPDLFMLLHIKDFAHFKQWPDCWPRPTKLNISKIKFILLPQIPPPASSFSISADGTIIYLFTQVIFITSSDKRLLSLEDNLKSKSWDFSGGAVVKNPPAIAGDTGSSPGPGRSHMPQSN